MKFFKYYFAIIAFLFAANINAQNVIYVSTSGNDSYPGNSLSFPKATLGSAIQVAGNGDTIKFSAGTYMISSVTQLDQGLLDSIVIMGAGKDQTIFKGGSSGWLNIVNNPSEGDNPNHYVLKDFKVKDMAKSSDPGDVDDNSPYLKGAAIYSKNANNILLENIHFEGCSASHAPSGNGGALYFNTGYGININNCTFNDNYSRNQGAAISMLYPTVNITNCVFYNNSTNNTTTGLSGTVYFTSEGDSLFLNHCTFARNKTASTLIIAGGASIIKNSIFYNTSSVYDVMATGSLTGMHNSFYIAQGGLSAVTNISTDYPRFADSTNYDFRLLGGSPAIDFGEVTSVLEDIDGYMRNNPDAGAYESHCYTPVTGISLSQISPLSCYGASDGAIQAIVSGGESPFYFGWGSAKETNNLRSVQRNPGITVDSLYSANGDWVHLIVQDAFGCDYSDSIQLSSPAKIMTSIGLNNGIMCHGDSTASISVSASNGASPYTYSFGKTFNGTDLGTGSSDSLSLLPADSVFVKVQDNDGCFVYDTINISQPSAVNLHTNSYSPICPGGEGSVSATPSGGMGKFTVEWGSNYGQNDLGTTNGVSSGYSNQLHNVYPGIYAVTVTDSFGCKDSALVTLGNSANTAITITATQQNVDCYENSNGLISIITNGGSSPYSIDWVKNTMPNTIIQQVFSSIGGVDTLRNLVAGDYTVTVTDALGCQEISSISVTEPSQFMLTMEVKENVDCFGGTNGEAKATITGGTANYTYDWGTTAGGDDIAKHPDKSVLVDSVANLAVGTYHLNITDDNGCSVSDVVTITGPNPVTISTTVNDTKCEGSSDGSIDFTVSGSNPPYSLLVSSVNWGTDTVYTSSGILQGAANEGPETLSAGTYYFSFTDDKGCTFNAISGNTTVSDPNPLTISPIETYASNLCSGNSIAKVRTYVEMDTEDNFNFYWLKKNEGGTFDTLQNNTKPIYEYDSLENLSGGWYYLHLRDVNNCLLEDSIEVAEPNPISTGFEMTQTLMCYGDSNASFEVSTAGGTPSYYYEFGTSHGASDILASESQALTGQSSDSVFVKITDANSCVHYDTVFIDQPSVLQLDLGSDFSLCLNKTQTLSPSVSGGTGNITYNWSPSTGIDNSHAANPNLTASTVGVGAYELNLTVVDENGCSNEDSLNYSIYPTLTETVNANLCYGYAITLDDTTITTSGTYVRTYASQVTGCDSVVTYNITVYPSHDTTINEGICDGDVYSASDTSFATSGTYVRTYTSQVTGCDSVVTYNIFVLASLGSVVNASICEGDSYTAPDTVFSTPGSYTRTYVSVINGCDSAVIYNITVHSQKDTTISEDLCYGDSYSAPDTVFSTSGTYVRTYTSAQTGCDSIVTYNINVYPSKDSIINVSFCEGESYSASDTTFSNTGTYIRTYTSELTGCDSTVTYNIDEKSAPVFGLTSDLNLCSGSSTNLSIDSAYPEVQWSNGDSGESINVSPSSDETYKVIVTDYNGCSDSDSVAVTVVESYQFESWHYMCQGDSVLWKDTLLKTDGAYSKIYVSQSGCDSIFILNVVVNPLPNITLSNDTAICDGDSVNFKVEELYASYSWSNGSNLQEIKVGSSGTYSVTATDYLGCSAQDSIELTVNPIVNVSVDASICSGQSYTAHDTTITTDGSYTRIIQTSAGCDSVVTYNIAIVPQPEYSLTDTLKLCPGEAKEVLLGLPDYLINWTAKNDGAYSNDNDHVSFSQADIYYLSVTDPNHGCNTLDTLVVDTINAPELVFTSDKVNYCAGELATFSGSGAAHYFLYQKSQFGDYALIRDEVADEVTFSNYDFDNNDVFKLVGANETCADSAEIQLTRASIINLSLTWSRDKLCGDDTTLVELVADGAYQFTMNGASLDNHQVYISEGGSYVFEAIDSIGCKASQDFNLVQYPDLTPDLQNDAVANTICKDSAVTFFVDAQDYYTLYQFYVNDSAGLVQSGVSNSYTASNLNHNDMIGVTVDDTNGCRFMDFQTINIEQCIGACPIIVANYNYSIDGYTISLMDSSQGPRTNMAYILEGATIGTNDTVLYSTGGPGFYEICLSVFDSVSNCGAEYCSVIEVSDTSNNDSVSICNASFNYSISEDTLFVEQNAQGAYSEFMWSFAAQATSSDSNTFHIFESSGYYEVCLAIYDSASGCQSQSCQMIEITYSSAAEDTVRCLANFSYFMSVEDLKVNFTNTSQGNATSFYWDFGNGIHSSSLNPEVIFDQEGYYTVELTSYDSLTGCQSSYQRVIELVDAQTQEACMADFDYYLDLESKIIYLENKSKGSYSNININFGDGNYSNDTLVHQYASPGIYDVTLTIFDIATACQASITKSVEVIDSNTQQAVCLADFTFYPNFENSTLNLSSAALGNIDKYYWTLSNGAVSFEENPSIAIANDGWIEVCLTVMNTQTGCQSEICKQVEYIDVTTTEVYCNANFEFFADLNSGMVYFNNTSEGNISNYYWSFGDGSYSTDTSLEHLYSTQGIYNVSLTTYDIVTGCHSKYEELVELVSDTTIACEAHFTFVPDIDQKWVAFENKSLGDFDRYFWSFGDGNFSEEENPEHIYDDYGYYDVCLTVYDAFTQCQTNYCYTVAIIDPEGINCKADFDVFYDIDNKKVEFINKSEGDFDRYHWNFGDGQFSDEVSPSNSYQDYGYYGVSLTVYHRASQCQAQKIKPIELIDTEEVFCNADFSYFPDGDSIIFKNESVGHLSDFFWILGDGAVSKEFNPSHYYQEGGIYQVSLNIFDPETGCNSMIEKSVEVIDTARSYCNAYFSFYPYETGDVIFNNESRGNYTNLYWDLGDNTFSNEESITHTYEKGYYNVSLTVIDTANGCIHTYREEIVAGRDISEEQSCQADFTFYESNPGVFNFENTSKGQYEIGFWEMGDGRNYTDNGTPIPHSYASDGYYEVTLTVIDTALGCFNSTTKTVVALDTNGNEQAICNPSFSYFPQNNDLVVKFADESKGDVTNRYWDFGDDSAPSFGENPSHPYRSAGYYNVCLTIFNADGCQETFCDVIAVGNVEHSCYADFAYYVDVLDAFAKFNNNALGENLTHHWDFGDDFTTSALNPGHTYADTGYYPVCLTVRNDSGCISTKCKDISVGNVLRDICLFNCVWPGDANGDKNVNHYDLLPIGLNYGKEGPQRDTIDLSWRGHSSTNWSTWQADSTNNMHADCNGDGVINSLDMIAIDSNWGKSHNRKYKLNAEGAELSLVIEGDVVPGESVTIDVIAGDDIVPLQMYGVGFELGFDVEQADVRTAVVSWSDSWLDDNSDEPVIDEWGGDEEVESDDLISDNWLEEDDVPSEDETLWSDDWINDEDNTEFMHFDKADTDNNLLMVSGTRLDKRNITGAGVIATITFIVNADYSGDSLDVNVFSNGAIKAEGDDIELANNEVVVAVKHNRDAFEYKSMNVYPNPTLGNVQFFLSMNELHDIELIDIAGRVVYKASQVEGGLKQLDLSEFQTGLYTIIVRGSNSLLRQKIELIR